MPEIRAGEHRAWFLDETYTAIVYMDGVDWQHHTLEDPQGATLYGTVENLKKSRGCLEECGIVELELRFRRWAEPQTI